MAKVPPSILDLRRRKQKPSFRGRGLKTMYTSERQAAYTFPSVLADAKFAYSTYDLYGSGRPVIRLRDTVTHSGGDTERDFTAKELTDGTLTNWAISEAPDGIKVAKLYDQAFRKPVIDREVTVPNTSKIAHPEPVHLANETAQAQPSFRRDDLTIKFDTYDLYYAFPAFQGLYGAEPGGNSIEREKRVRVGLEVNGPNAVANNDSSSYKIGTPNITFLLSMKTAEVNAADQINFTHYSGQVNIVNPNHMRKDFAYAFGIYADTIQGWNGVELHPAASVYAPYGPVPIGAQDGFHFGNNFLPTVENGGTNVLKLGLNGEDYPSYGATIRYSSTEITTSLETYTFQHRGIPNSTQGYAMEGWKSKTKVMSSFDSQVGFGTSSGVRMRQISLGNNHFRTSVFLLYGGEGPTPANPHLRGHYTGLSQEEINQIDDHLESFYNY